LADDPLATVAGLYERLGWQLGPDARVAMTAYVDANPKGRFGRHDYDLASFGLDEREVAERFSTYCARFDLT
jgi:hypothetical protein